MNSTYFIVFLITTLFFNSVITLNFDHVQPRGPRESKSTESPKSIESPKPPESRNNYASPQLYVFGGFDSSKPASAQNLSSASQFNSSTGEWERTTAMSTPRSDFCGAVVGTKIYLFGGFYADKQALETAEVYDCETGVHSPFRSMPSERAACGAAVLDDYIYVAGGYEGEEASGTVIRYSIQTTRRENVNPMHTKRRGLQLVELGGSLYAIGGGTKIVEKYTSITGRWTTVASTELEHEFFGATVHEKKIHVCSENGCEVYDPKEDEWETLTPLNNYRGRALVSMKEKLWALGGGDEGATSSVFTYKTQTNKPSISNKQSKLNQSSTLAERSARKWMEQASMDVARKYFTAFVINH